MKKDQYLYLKSFTWSRDSHGLFDYESKSVQKKCIKIDHSGKAYRVGNDVNFIGEDMDISHLENCINLANISINNSQYFLSEVDEPLWLSLRNSKPEELKNYTLNEGTIMKLGRVKFKISALHTSNQEPSMFIQDAPESIIPEDGLCRICLCGQIDEDNPLISPCVCKGTMKYIHIQCLQKWVSSKFSTKVGSNSVIFCWKSMDCELCKNPYPASIKMGRNVYAIFTAGEIQNPYFMLESMSRDSNNHRMLYLVSFTNKCSITLGRGHDSDLRVSDISVSRCHAVIKYVNGAFILEDKSSKFGTLVMCNEPQRIEGEEELVLQVGRTVLEVCLKNVSSEDYSFDEDL